MARFSLSFLTVFLVLAAFAMSMPTKRDENKDLGLDTALSGLEDAAKLVGGFNNKNHNDHNNEVKKDQATANHDSTEKKQKDTIKEKEGVATPTPTQKKLTSGNFVTPTATHTTHPTSQPNILGKIPLLGGLLGGAGGGL
ncbi:uncharacterized protein N7482_002266 [Penicillium canariense]|uniref:Uncharacterized protein n=1 Tax=Penicillium canariense TaxID=189055 RepID=A0A9W9LUN7_9EURO|nr:uncharacterized protein N7482_002266 [Penicillium canariense]KAJ5176389.1 hypothetical protein N7482_002266 [Penicillium canariense]